MRRWTLIPITVMVCGALVAGCTSEKAKTTATPTTAAPSPGPIGVAAPLSKLVHVAVSTTLISTVHFTMRSTLKGDGQPAEVTVTGTCDMRRHKGTQDIALSSGPVRTARELLTPQQVYYTSGDPTKGPWTSVARRDLQLRHLLRPPANDPVYPLVQAKVMFNVVDKGTGPLDGLTDVHHYAGVIPSVTMLQDAAALQRDHLGAILDAMPKSVTPVDIWIDKNGRVVRVTEQISADSEGFSGTLTIDLSAYGIDVKVAAPKTSTAVKVGALPANLLG